jgi:hypothetical protein
MLNAPEWAFDGNGSANLWLHDGFIPDVLLCRESNFRPRGLSQDEKRGNCMHHITKDGFCFKENDHELVTRSRKVVWRR